MAGVSDIFACNCIIIIMHNSTIGVRERKKGREGGGRERGREREGGKSKINVDIHQFGKKTTKDTFSLR